MAAMCMATSFGGHFVAFELDDHANARAVW